MVLSSYSAVMIVAGGSGVTFALSEAEEVVQMLQRGKSRIRFIDVVWITQDMSKDIFLPCSSWLISALRFFEPTYCSVLRDSLCL